MTPALLPNWDTFAVVTGIAAAVLLGLLFVAAAVRGGAFGGGVRGGRASQTVALLLAGLLASVLLAVPGQRAWALGLEYLVLALLLFAAALWLDPGLLSRGSVEASLVTAVLVLASGVVLVLGHWDGLYVLVPALVAALAGGAVNAWLILARQPV